MKLVSPSEAAAILGVSKDTIIRYLRAEKFKTVNLGVGTGPKTIRIDLAAWFIEQGIDPVLYMPSSNPK